jgi:murein DD-endopeptidase MepM/ murein hydrolase activator NlpD
MDYSFVTGFYVIGSGFKDPRRGGHHYGVDFIAARHTPIYAASNGTVLTAQCASSTRRDAGSCDVDGSSAVKGCGWYVEITHLDNIITMYCHLTARPLLTEGDPVTVGQHIGDVGSSGNSSGPHLHFQIHKGHTAISATAIPCRIPAQPRTRHVTGDGLDCPV